MEGQIDSMNDIPYINFHNVGLSGSKDVKKILQRLAGHKVALAPGAEFKGARDVMALLNHTFVDIFKIDCEGCELQLFSDLLRPDISKKPLFGQVQVEIHW